MVMAGYTAARRASEQRTLMTRQMREAEMARKAASFGQVPIRIEFPDGMVLQASFAATETLEQLRSLVQGVLIPELASCFYLFVTPPKTEFKDMQISLYKAGLVPAARIHVGFRDLSALLKDKPSLKLEIMSLQRDPPARYVAMGRLDSKRVTEQQQEEEEEARPGKTTNEGKRSQKSGAVPSWMKLSAK